jgi:hypothetical protein
MGSPPRKLSRYSEVGGVEGDWWNVLVQWPFHSYQPLHIVTKLFTASCNVVTYAQLVRLRSTGISPVHSLQMNTGDRSFQTSAKLSLFKTKDKCDNADEFTSEIRTG